MGIGGALMWPAILGMTYAILPEDKAGLAGGVILGAAGLGNAMGPLIGGVLTDALSWRWIFFLNVPIAIFAVAVTYFLVKVKEPEAGEQRIDYRGIAALSVGLVSLLIALDQVADWGWGDPRVIGLLALAAVLVVAFVPIERRAGSHALVPSEVMRNESFRASCVAILFMSATFFAALLYLPQFMQKQLGYSPLEAGVGILPFLATFALVSFVAGPLYDRVGAKRLAAFGAACITVAPFLFSQVDVDSGYDSLIVGMVVLGVGIGSFYPTATTAGVTSVDESQTSLAGGIVYMFQIAGGSIGLGLTTTVFSVRDPAVRRRHPGRLPARRRALAGRLPDRALLRRRPAARRAARRSDLAELVFAPVPAAESASWPAPPRRTSSPAPPNSDVDAVAAEQHVVAVAADQLVGAVAAAQLVVARAADQRVAPGAAAHRHRDRRSGGETRTQSSPPSALTSKAADADRLADQLVVVLGRVVADVAADFERDDRVDHVAAAVGGQPDPHRVRLGAAREQHVVGHLAAPARARRGPGAPAERQRDQECLLHFHPAQRRTMPASGRRLNNTNRPSMRPIA